LFGNIYPASNPLGITAPEQGALSAALFLGPSSNVYAGTVLDDYSFFGTNSEGQIGNVTVEGNAQIALDSSLTADDPSAFGIALVKSTTTSPPAPMPEPSILMLFAGGLLGLGLIRRRQKKH